MIDMENLNPKENNSQSYKENNGNKNTQKDSENNKNDSDVIS